MNEIIQLMHLVSIAIGLLGCLIMTYAWRSRFFTSSKSNGCSGVANNRRPNARPCAISWLTTCC